MGKIAGILADAVSTRATSKEAADYIETILSAKNRKTPEELKEMDPEALGKYIADMAAKKK